MLGKGASQLMIISRGGLDNKNGSSSRYFLRLSKAGRRELIGAQFSFYPSFICNEINSRDGSGTISLLPRWGEPISSSCAALHASPTAPAHGEKHQKNHPFYHTWLFCNGLRVASLPSLGETSCIGLAQLLPAVPGAWLTSQRSPASPSPLCSASALMLAESAGLKAGPCFVGEK